MKSSYRSVGSTGHAKKTMGESDLGFRWLNSVNADADLDLQIPACSSASFLFFPTLKFQNHLNEL